MKERFVAARTAAALVLGLAVLFASPASAQPSRATQRLQEAAMSAWSGCARASASGAEISEMINIDALGWDVAIRRVPGGFRLDASDASPGGVEATYGALSLLIEPASCRALWAQTSTWDGSLEATAQIEWTNRAAPNDEELELILARPARPPDATDAFARAWLGHICAGGVESSLYWPGAAAGPIAPAQAWHDGPPPRPSRSYWSRAVLAAIGSESRISSPGVAGLVVDARVRRPRRTFVAAGVVLYEAELGGRNGGQAIAIFDPQRNRHRWVVATRGCVQGTRVVWAGAIGDRIVGVTRSRHPVYASGDAIVILDVPSGTAWAVQIPSGTPLEELPYGARVRASISGANLLIRAGSRTATVDLAPALDWITRARGPAP